MRAANAEGALRQIAQRPFDVRLSWLYQKKPGITSTTVPVQVSTSIASFQ
jgi:hypothetical protein